MGVRKDRNFYVSLALHQAVSAELKNAPERVRQLGLQGVQKVLPHNRGRAIGWVREWERALRDRDWPTLHHHLPSDDETSVEMRNCKL